MTSPIGAGEAAVIAASIAASVQFIPWLAKAIGKRRLESRRMTIESVRQDADRLNGSYRRLEAENARLWNRVNSLETAIAAERELHEETKQWCNKLVRELRRAGVQLPPNENGPPQ
jgi:chromosome segregation ATPase